MICCFVAVHITHVLAYADIITLNYGTQVTLFHGLSPENRTVVVFAKLQKAIQTEILCFCINKTKNNGQVIFIA